MQLKAIVLQRLATANIPMVANCFFVSSEKRVYEEDSLLLLLLKKIKKYYLQTIFADKIIGKLLMPFKFRKAREA